jgi:hypothetical protein
MGEIFDSFRVEEAYNWHDDIMEITRRIVHETDEARLSNIAEHFEVDLSEIRRFLEIKRQQKCKSTPIVETGIYDIEEVHPNCTVQIWRNSQTGEESIGWWPNE